MPHYLSVTNERGDKFDISLDPLDAYTSDTQEELIEYLGLVPTIAMQSVGESFYERISNGYEQTAGGTPNWNCNAKIRLDGRYDHPEDSLLSPMMKMVSTNDGSIAYIYAYGFVAVEKVLNNVVQKNEFICGRCN